MEEKSLLGLSLFFSVAGIVILFFLAKNIEVSDTTIEKLDSSGTGAITLSGMAQNVRHGKGFTSFELVHEDSLKVMAFSDVDVNDNDTLKVTGRIDDEGLVADKIEVAVR